MTDKEWEKFFELLNQIVNKLPGTWEDKKELLISKADENGATTDLSEITDWFN